MKVAIMLGSKGRVSHKVACYLEKLLLASGVSPDLIDLGAELLPHYDDQDAMVSLSKQKIAAMGVRLQQSDALIFVSPEFHGSFSGILKNALDHYCVQFQKKPIGVVTTSVGSLGGINASLQLQHVILSLGAFPLPLMLVVPEVHRVFPEGSGSDSGEPLLQSMVRNTQRFLNEFLWFTQAIVQAKPMIVRWSPENALTKVAV
jgi:azobenzene reductase